MGIKGRTPEGCVFVPYELDLTTKDVGISYEHGVKQIDVAGGETQSYLIKEMSMDKPGDPVTVYGELSGGKYSYIDGILRHVAAGQVIVDFKSLEWEGYLG